MPVPHQTVAGVIDIVENPKKIPSSPLQSVNQISGESAGFFLFSIFFSKYCATRQDRNPEFIRWGTERIISRSF